MDDNCFNKPIKPRVLGVDITGNTVYACPECCQVIVGNPEKCYSCGQTFSYEKGELE
jgi:hypothetical protein